MRFPSFAGLIEKTAIRAGEGVFERFALRASVGLESRLNIQPEGGYNTNWEHGERRQRRPDGGLTVCWARP